MAEKQYYPAFDLGTTNSVCAYGNIVNNIMKPVVVDIERKNDTGSTSRNSSIPSVVYYYKNKDGKFVCDVGDYAKSRYGTLGGYVCKSVKSLMGVADSVPLVDEIPDRSPSDVSAQILTAMVNGAKKRLFQKDLNDVVITVPASFDSDQCQATLDAAKKAGINVENMHDVLLYEPKAVIYEFMRMQEQGEVPSDLLSLDSDKTVLVYDLGGGTLDVTIHRVGYTPEGIINIKDLAISRYTLLGGDNFDELLAQEMLSRFEQTYVRVPLKRREEVMCRLRKLAENLKMELSMTYDSAMDNGVVLPDDYEFEVMDAYLYDAYSYEDVFTKAEIEKILDPLMGRKYSREDVQRISSLGEKDVENMIYPILDVLDKAGKNLKIDAVILNGGMTKFYLIRERLKEFFGFEPLTTSDPDLAVAKGAVYYHYCLHKYNIRRVDYAMELPERKEDEDTVKKVVFNTSTILNDTINIGLRGEYVDMLIPAGTELPFKGEEIRSYELDKMTDTVGVELFLGRGLSKNLPNRRIATRTVKFKKAYPEGTQISFQIAINAMRMMTMEAWITGNPSSRQVMEMDIASLKTADKCVKNLRSNKKRRLNAKSECYCLKDLAARNKGNNHKFNEQIKAQVAACKLALNPEDFFDPLMDLLQECKQKSVMNGYVYDIAAALGEGFTDSERRSMLSKAKQHFSPDAAKLAQDNFVLRKAIDFIALYDQDFAAFANSYLDANPRESLSIRQAFLLDAIKYEKDPAKLAKLLQNHLGMAEFNSHIARLLGKRLGFGQDKTNNKLFLKFLRKLCDEMNDCMKKQEYAKIPSYLPATIAELCGEDSENSLQEDHHSMKNIWKVLKKYMDNQADDIYKQAITDLWNGIGLSENEKTVIKLSWAEANGESA